VFGTRKFSSAVGCFDSLSEAEIREYMGSAENQDCRHNTGDHATLAQSPFDERYLEENEPELASPTIYQEDEKTELSSCRLQDFRPVLWVVPQTLGILLQINQ